MSRRDKITDTLAARVRAMCAELSAVHEIVGDLQRWRSKCLDRELEGAAADLLPPVVAPGRVAGPGDWFFRARA